MIIVGGKEGENESGLCDTKVEGIWDTERRRQSRIKAHVCYLSRLTFSVFFFQETKIRVGVKYKDGMTNLI